MGQCYSLKEVCNMVLQDLNMQNLANEEKNKYISNLAQAQDVKQHGVHANNPAATQDVLAIMNCISREVGHSLLILCCFHSISHTA